MSIKQEFKKSIPLGCGTALAVSGFHGQVTLTLMEPSFADEQVYTPATCIKLWGLQTVKDLKSLCEELIKAEKNIKS